MVMRTTDQWAWWMAMAYMLVSGSGAVGTLIYVSR